MANAERTEYVKVDLSQKNPFGLTVHRTDKNRSLFIKEPKGFGAESSKDSQDLLRTVMIAHLIARHFPVKIETNFPVEQKIFLDELYGHYGYKPPVIKKGRDVIIPEFVRGKGKSKEKILYANAHSGGVDSIYRVARLISEDKEVAIFHLRNLNPKGNYREAVASRKQAEVLGVPYEETILRNGSDNTGFAAMRTRDMFLGLVVAIAAEQYSAKKVFIEGDMQTDPSSHFSEYGPAWDFFNGLIKEVGLHSQIEGMDAHDIETIGEVLALEKDLSIKFGHKVELIPLVQNCFTAAYQMGNNRRKWERETRTIAENSPYHWCGSCVKCRRMTLARLCGRDDRFAKVPQKEINYFIEDTYRWLEDYPNNRDLISESFMRHLKGLSDMR